MNTREAFLSELYKFAHKDNDVFFIAADLGSPSLDNFRKNLSGQFINIGIAEQSAVLTASGIALTGKRTYVYGLAQFLALRAFEQVRVYPAAMNLNVTIVGTSVGIANDVAGPTHHTVEDIALMRMLPNMKIWSISDVHMARAFAEMSYEIEGPKYIRIDNENLPDIYNENTDFSHKIHSFGKRGEELCLIACGNMLHVALKVQDILNGQGISIQVADLSMLPVSREDIEALSAKQIYTLEEHNLAGGMGSHILEITSGMPIQIHRIGFDFSKAYYRKNGDRRHVHKECKMDAQSVAMRIKENIKAGD